jgi:hypothetical protein
MRGFAYISAAIMALGVSACSADMGDEAEGFDEAEVTDSVSEALSYPPGYGFRINAMNAASVRCTNLVDCYLPRDKNVNWRRLNDGKTPSGTLLSDVFKAELTYQTANAPTWHVMSDASAKDTVANVALPGAVESRMLVVAPIDHLANPVPPGGKRHLYHGCRVEIDIKKIGINLAGVPPVQVNNYVRNVLRREMYACLGLGLNSGGPMLPNQPPAFRASVIPVTAAQKSVLAQYQP